MGQSVEGVKFSELALGDDMADVGAYVKSGFPEVDIYPIDDPVNQFFKLFHGSASLEEGDTRMAPHGFTSNNRLNSFKYHINSFFHNIPPLDLVRHSRQGMKSM